MKDSYKEIEREFRKKQDFLKHAEYFESREWDQKYDDLCKMCAVFVETQDIKKSKLDKHGPFMRHAKLTRSTHMELAKGILRDKLIGKGSISDNKGENRPCFEAFMRSKGLDIIKHPKGAFNKRFKTKIRQSVSPTFQIANNENVWIQPIHAKNDGAANETFKSWSSSLKDLERASGENNITIYVFWATNQSHYFEKFISEIEGFKKKYPSANVIFSHFDDIETISF